VSRELFVYVKRAHVDVVPGIKELVGELVGNDAVGEDGYLGQIGLIPLPPAELEKARQTASALAPNVAAPTPAAL
jgi:phosphate transport system substrate-binding protein